MRAAFSLAKMSLANKQSWSRRLLLRCLEGLKGGAIRLHQDGYPSVLLGDSSAELRIEIQVQDPLFFNKILRGGSVAAGESYIDDGWRCSDLHLLLNLLAANREQLSKLESRLSYLSDIMLKFKHFLRRNHKRQAKRNILAHYDLGNDFYASFLDPNMQYSAALFAGLPLSLEQAQRNKMHQICQQLDLQSSDHLLEIGSGWGGLALFAAQSYGCRVTTTTISDEQYKYVCGQVKDLGLSEQITVLNNDYRDLNGSYDKLVSIEMIEAVGERYLTGFAKLCEQRLKPGGVMLIQAITIAEHRFSSYRKGVDFIQQYVFPGGFLPSSDLLENIFNQQGLTRKYRLQMGADYAQTLNCWHQAVQGQRQKKGNAQGKDDAFYRLWHFYFAYCEAGFRSGNIGTEQLTLQKA